MQRKRNFLIVLLVGTAFLCQGCVVAVLGLGAAGAVAYSKGDLEVVEAENINKVYEAALQMIEQTNLRLINVSQDSFSATITANNAQNKKIVLSFKSKEKKNTALSIRVGTFGDKELSRRIYEQIHENIQNIKEKITAQKKWDDSNLYNNMPVTYYNYDASTGKGAISVDISGRGIEARQMIIENIGRICADKNITLIYGKDVDQEAHYMILDENLENGILTIEFEALW